MVAALKNAFVGAGAPTPWALHGARLLDRLFGHHGVGANALRDVVEESVASGARRWWRRSR